MTTTIDYFHSFPCPVCGNWNPCHNIAGDCLFCGSQGFKTLKNKGEKNGRGEI